MLLLGIPIIIKEKLRELFDFIILSCQSSLSSSLLLELFHDFEDLQSHGVLAIARIWLNFQ